MNEREKKAVVLTEEETVLHERFERWLKNTGEAFQTLEYDGENYVVYVAGSEPEIYEPALVRELIADEREVF